MIARCTVAWTILTMMVKGLLVCFVVSPAVAAERAKTRSYEPFVWPSTPPANCPFAKSEDLHGILFTGRHSDYRVADTWYPFRVSRDYGRTWTCTAHTPEKPLFGETGRWGYPVKIGAPHFVDFGQNMEHSPDGKAYLVAHGAVESDFVNLPSKFISKDGHTAWLCYSANFGWMREHGEKNPPGSRYGLVLQQMHLLSAADAEDIADQGAKAFVEALSK